MKLWKVLARTSHVYSSHVNKNNQLEMYEFKSGSPTFSDDSGRNSTTTSDSGQQFATVQLRKRTGESLGIILTPSAHEERELSSLDRGMWTEASSGGERSAAPKRQHYLTKSNAIGPISRQPKSHEPHSEHKKHHSDHHRSRKQLKEQQESQPSEPTSNSDCQFQNVQQQLRHNIDNIRSRTHISNRPAKRRHKHVKHASLSDVAEERMGTLHDLRDKIDVYRANIKRNVNYLQNKLVSKGQHKWNAKYTTAAEKLAEVNQLLTQNTTDCFDVFGVDDTLPTALGMRPSQSLPDASYRKCGYLTSRSEIVFSCCPCACTATSSSFEPEYIDSGENDCDICCYPPEVHAEVISNDIRMVNSNEFLICENIMLQRTVPINQQEFRSMIGDTSVCRLCKATLRDIADALTPCKANPGCICTQTSIGPNGHETQQACYVPMPSSPGGGYCPTCCKQGLPNNLDQFKCPFNVPQQYPSPNPHQNSAQYQQMPSNTMSQQYEPAPYTRQASANTAPDDELFQDPKFLSQDYSEEKKAKGKKGGKGKKNGKKKGAKPKKKAGKAKKKGKKGGKGKKKVRLSVPKKAGKNPLADNLAYYMLPTLRYPDRSQAPSCGPYHQPANCPPRPTPRRGLLCSNVHDKATTCSLPDISANYCNPSMGQHAQLIGFALSRDKNAFGLNSLIELKPTSKNMRTESSTHSFHSNPESEEDEVDPEITSSKSKDKEGNSEAELCPSIASLRPGSVALTSDQLTPGDRIHSVNGINTSRMRPEEVSTLLDNVDGNALLEIEYCLPSYASQNSLCLSSKVTEVTVERIDSSLGITLRGGFVPDHPHLSRPLVITQVRPHGPAYKTGLIRVGDRLLKVDNFNLTNKTLLEAQKILKDSSHLPLSSLTIEYDVSIMESVKYATGPLLVEIDRHANEDLGLLLSNCSCDFTSSDEITSAGVYIDHIIPASTADRCGALNMGDQLLAIDDYNLMEWNGGLQEAERLLKTAAKIQIMPLHALQRISARQQHEAYRAGPYANSPSASGFSTLNSKRSRSRNNARNNNRHSSISKSIEDTASNYCGYTTSLGVCHSETLSVTIVAERGKGYGLSVGVTEHDDTHPADIVVARISPDSPAYRCGCLQNGDRIISVNHRTNLTLQEINAILELGSEPTNSSKQLTLQIEFDVADTIVPSSGIFTVKLARRGPGLGITITASKSHPEDPFIISEIRRGSVAHRTGTLHAGDRLLAIDNRQLDHLSVESAFDILQASSNDIVTLKVEKTENTLLDSIVYTVELLRHGGPLGITIAGSEDCSEPIVLSRLTEGGLAEKTGALHVGDRLLAINGENLEQKPLSEAIRLLQASGDRVQLKISRNLKPEDEGRCNYSSPGLTSIDSAVHSWDSNPPDSTESTFDPQLGIKDFESVLSEPLSYQEPDKEHDQYRKHDSQLQFYSDAEDVFCPSPLPLPNYNLGLSQYSHYSHGQLRNNFTDTNSFANLFDSDVYHVTLYKDSVYDDYGFSVSDGLYEKGVYINRIRKGGPADIVGMLKPYDRIIQVNDTKTQDFDCCLTVPLIASAGDRIDLVITRNPFVISNSQDNLCRKSFSASNNTITKTL